MQYATIQSGSEMGKSEWNNAKETNIPPCLVDNRMI